MEGSTQTILNQSGAEKAYVNTVYKGSIAEGFVSGVALVLTLLGLSGLMSELMLPLAVIVVGVALLLEGIAISARFSTLLAATSTDRLDKAEFGVGVTAEFLGGIAGIVLGILALIKIAAAILVPVALIVYGVTFMLSSGATHRLNTIEVEGSAENTRFKKIAREAMSVSTALELVLGLGAVVLGILAILGTYSATVSLVGMLVISVAGLLTGAAVTSRMMALFRS